MTKYTEDEAKRIIPELLEQLEIINKEMQIYEALVLKHNVEGTYFDVARNIYKAINSLLVDVATNYVKNGNFLEDDVSKLLVLQQIVTNSVIYLVDEPDGKLN